MGIRSMFSGISGLQAHSTWLDVIGNNIANTNTVAYKASRVEFADQISQTIGAAQGDEFLSGFGGVNPEQVGLGTRVASIQTNFNEGPTLNTGINTDMAIIGNGFLIAKSGSQTFYTRQGNLTFDSEGNLVDQNGGLIQGWTAKAEFKTRTINSVSAVNPNGMLATDASLVLDNTNVSLIGNIQIKRDMVLPPKATTVMQFSGNLDSFQTAVNNADMGAAGAEILPWAQVGGLNAAYMTWPFGLANGGQAMQQVDNLQDPALQVQVNEDPQLQSEGLSTLTQATVGEPLQLAGETLATAQGNATNAWQQQPPIPPSHVSTETVYDSTGNQRTITIQFYQVNDLGQNPNGGAGINTPPMNQAVYAWYAFDTTGGKPVSNATLIGGTGIIEGDQSQPTGAGPGYDRGYAGDQFWGDFVWFNTDGSLGNMGAVDQQGLEAGTAGAGQARPHLYLSPIQDDQGPAPVGPIPSQGADTMDVVLDFGTPGMLGGPGVANPGRRDGLYSDAEGTYTLINGVNTYVPNSTAYVKEQDGYTDGQLLGVSWDNLGDIIGHFNNGQDVALAQVAMAMPNNQEGFAKVGGNYYQTTANSGPMFVGHAGQLGIGTTQGDALEGSNVDLTVELSNMIIAQRGFEVNARVIAVTNSTMQTTVQLGQGG